MKKAWEWVRDDQNRSAAQLLVSVVTGVVGGAWALFSYFGGPAAPIDAKGKKVPDVNGIVVLSDSQAKLINRAASIYYYKDDTGTFSVNIKQFLEAQSVRNQDELGQFDDVAKTNIRECSDKALAASDADSRIAERNKCLNDKNYNHNTLKYLRARFGLEE